MDSQHQNFLGVHGGEHSDVDQLEAMLISYGVQ